MPICFIMHAKKQGALGPEGIFLALRSAISSAVIMVLSLLHDLPMVSKWAWIWALWSSVIAWKVYRHVNKIIMKMEAWDKFGRDLFKKLNTEALVKSNSQFQWYLSKRIAQKPANEESIFIVIKIHFYLQKLNTVSMHRNINNTGTLMVWTFCCFWSLFFCRWWC